MPTSGKTFGEAESEVLTLKIGGFPFLSPPFLYLPSSSLQPHVSFLLFHCVIPVTESGRSASDNELLHAVDFSLVSP